MLVSRMQDTWVWVKKKLSCSKPCCLKIILKPSDWLEALVRNHVRQPLLTTMGFTREPGPAVLSKVENPGSPNWPFTVDRWLARVAFGWPVYDAVINDNETTISQCVIYFQPVIKKCEIDISNSQIAWKFERWLSSNAAKPYLSFTWLEYFKTQPHSFESWRDMSDIKIRLSE